MRFFHKHIFDTLIRYGTYFKVTLKEPMQAPES